jgi:hypothetical protein
MARKRANADLNKKPRYPVEREELEPQLEKFVRHYRATYDGFDAAFAAGFERAEEVWPEILARPDVQARLRCFRAGIDTPDRGREGLRDYLLARFNVDISPLIRIDPDTGLASYDLRRATPEQLAALEIEETVRFQNNKQTRILRIRPRDNKHILHAVLQSYGLYEPDPNGGQDSLSLALVAISKKGSPAPIATAKDCGPQ